MAPDGSGGDEISRDAAISANGRFVAFISGASNLVPGETTGAAGVFLRDRHAGTTGRIPLPAGVTDVIGPPSVSRRGRFVVFAANGPELDVQSIITHIYLHDRLTGATEQISTPPSGHLASDRPAISADGRMVAYFSWTQVRDNPNGVLNVVVYNRRTRHTSFANTTGEGQVISAPFDPDYGLAISGNGRIVAFTFGAALVAGAPGGQVFVHDVTTGTTSIASMTTSGTPSEGGHFFRPAVSADGRFVAFYSSSALVPEDTNGMPDTYVRDRSAQTTERVDVDNAGNQLPRGTNLADSPAISGSGRFVAFVSADPGLTPGDTNDTYDVFVRDRRRGTAERVSVSANGAQANDLSFGPSISANGRQIAFTSAATNLSTVKNSAAGLDVYVREARAALGGRPRR